jgi:ClpP class serine protease
MESRDWFWILFSLFIVFMVLMPIFQRSGQAAARRGRLDAFQRARKSRVILLIHRQETVSFLGLPLARYIDIEDSEAILRAIRLTPTNVPIDLIVHTPGGLVLAAEQIAHALLRHQAPVTIFVPHYAMSGGTLLALACDQIVMDPNAVLGPVDPQLGPFAAASILEAVAQKPVAQVSDQTLMMADLARKALAQVRGTVISILTIGGMDRAQAEALAETLATGTVTHDYPISFERAKALGLPVSDEFPDEVHELMSQYSTPSNRRPSVMYVPLPTGEGGAPAHGQLGPPR